MLDFTNYGLSSKHKTQDAVRYFTIFTMYTNCISLHVLSTH